MDSGQFIQVVGDAFEGWLRAIIGHFACGRLQVSGPWSTPTILRVVETREHFIAELCGATNCRDSTKVHLARPRGTEKSVDAATFFNGGFECGPESESMIRISTHDNWIASILFATDYDRDVFQKKVNFPLKECRFYSNHFTVPLWVSPVADRIGLFDVDVVRTDGVRVLFRTISTAICVRRDLSSSELRSWIRHSCESMLDSGVPIGLNFFSASGRDMARELCSLADQNVSELTLDRFIRGHGDFFQGALSYKAHQSQAHLKWVQRGPNDPEMSIPDYLLQRSDGYWDILDLKRAALRTSSIVRGFPSRPRFIDYVDEMIAQLARYQSYFEEAANAKWADEKYGVRVKDVRLIGIVGNYDTFNLDEVEIALRQFRDNLAIMSYSDVVNLLRAFESRLCERVVRTGNALP